MDTDKWLKVAVICFFVSFALMIVLDLVLMFMYRNTPITEIPIWGWWMLR